MERGLVVLREPEDAGELLETAGQHATGTDAELLLLSFISESEYEADVNALTEIGEVEDVTYSDNAVLEGVKQDVERAAEDVFSDLDVEYASIVTVESEDDYADRVIAAASEHNCDHLFMTGRGRTPTGKAIFGNQTQQVILQYDGFVTVKVE